MTRAGSSVRCIITTNTTTGTIPRAPTTGTTGDRIYAWGKSADASYNAKENGLGDRYGYDAEGQLTTASYQVTNPAGGASNPQRGWENFNYDALGNRKGTNILANRGSVTVTRKDNGLNQYLNWGGGRADYDDYYTPGANGVMIQNGLISSDFNALNQPNWVWSSPMPYVEAMGYDPLGRCVKRSSTGSLDPSANPATYFYYDGNDLIEEATSATTPTKFYFHGGRIDELAASCDASGSGDSYRFYHYDANGNCILLSDMGGHLLEQYEYDAFGKPYFFTSYGSQLTASNYGNRFLFTGREWLSEAGLYDYRARLYQPEVERFVQPDPKEFDAGDYNIYRYCHNDPVNRSDPFGDLEFEIEGNDEFRGEIQSHSDTIDSKPIGHALLQELRDSPFRMVIVPTTGGNITEPLNERDSMNGKGSGSRFSINPTIKDSAEDATGKTDRPAFIGTAHEVVGHGVDNKRGEHVSKKLDRHTDRIPGSEKRAMQRENEIRAEHSIPERIKYHKTKRDY